MKELGGNMLCEFSRNKSTPKLRHVWDGYAVASHRRNHILIPVNFLRDSCGQCGTGWGWTKAGRRNSRMKETS